MEWVVEYYLRTLWIDAVDIVRVIGDVWDGADVATRVDLRSAVLGMLGHAPDPVLTWDEIMNSMETVTTPVERGTGMLLSCELWGDCVCMPVTDNGIDDARRRLILSRILDGRSSRKEEKELRDSMIFQSETLRVRTRLVPRLAIKWLRGRRDLRELLPNLVGTAGMGAGAFCSYVASATAGGCDALHSLLVERGCYTCCIKCALASQKVFKVNVRYGSSDRPERDGEIFDWQYASHMLGRFDHECFADMSDLEERVDYDANLPVRNGVYHLKGEFDRRYEEAIAMEGRRFGFICAKALDTSGQAYHHLTEMALTKVPAGSIGAYGVNELAAAEIDKMHLNKKLAIIYLTKGEEEALKFGERHARSGWMWKLEIAKLRNLVPGTLGFYLSAARASAYGEARFLGTMENVPLMWSEARKEVENSKFAGWQELGYVACRDYKNYNLCHKHERMQLFYESAADVCKFMDAGEMAADFLHMRDCLDDVGVYVDGKYNKWEYGLQTGWAHTMLFHCVHNSCAGRVVGEMVSELTGWRRLAASHQGDDSREVWSNVMAGPLAQAILDAGGQVGQPEKQHFATTKGSWAEFLRVWYCGGVTRGSALRVIGGLVSADSQHSPYEGGADMIKTICEIVNDAWRRQGGVLKWRRSDISAVMEYWATSNTEFKMRGSADWRAMLSERFGLALGAYPDMQWMANGGEVKRRRRYNVEVGTHMLRRARRNLAAVGRAPRVMVYAAEYAEDMIASGVETSVDMVGIQVESCGAVGTSAIEVELDEIVAAGAELVVDDCLEGRMGWQDRDEFSKQVVVNHLFAGSERVACAYIRDNASISVHGSARLRENVKRGLRLFAGETSVDRALLRQNLVCAKKYWPHVEVYLRNRPYCVGVQRWLGYHVAHAAMRRGEWI